MKEGDTQAPSCDLQRGLRRVSEDSEHANEQNEPSGFNEKLSKGEQGSFWFDYDIRFKTWLHTDHSTQITVHRSQYTDH